MSEENGVILIDLASFFNLNPFQYKVSVHCIFLRVSLKKLNDNFFLLQQRTIFVSLLLLFLNIIMNNISTSTINPMVLHLNAARAAVQQIGQPMLFTIGMIGCILNILIFIRPSMRQNSCAIYFHASSWANFFCLTWGVLASMLAFFTKNNPASYNVVYCKIRFYMINFSQWSSRGFVVLACFDRFFLCSTSVHQRNFCRPAIAKKAIALTTFICACLPIYILVTYQPGPYIIPCYLTTVAAEIFETVLIWLFTLTIPTLSMSILSGLIIRRLKQNAKRVGREKVSSEVF
jgi:hypothetical protein